MNRITLILITSLLLSSCGESHTSRATDETGRPSLHNVALTHKQVAEHAAMLSRLPRGVPVAQVYENMPKLKGHGQEVIYPIADSQDHESNVVFFNQDGLAFSASERVHREKWLRAEWDATVKKHPFLTSAGWTPAFRVGKYTLNPTHALYVVTEHAAPGDERFVAAFVREESTD